MNLLILFQLLNLHLWQASHFTLHTAQFTLITTSANTPESEHVQFLLNIEHFTLHTRCLYCILQIYHFPLQISKLFLSWSQDLHGRNQNVPWSTHFQGLSSLLYADFFLGWYCKFRVRSLITNFPKNMKGMNKDW